MPGPAVVTLYVVAAIGTVTAGIAFKEFVYEPYIAPKIEQWREELAARRRARAQRRRGPAAPHASGGDERDGGDLQDAREMDVRSSVELESLVASERSEWRDFFNPDSELRNRRGHGHLNWDATSNVYIPHQPLTPTTLSSMSPEIPARDMDRTPSVRSAASVERRPQSPEASNPFLPSPSPSPIIASRGILSPADRRNSSQQPALPRTSSISSNIDNTHLSLPSPFAGPASGTHSPSASTRSFLTAHSASAVLFSAPGSPVASRMDAASPFSLADASDLDTLSSASDDELFSLPSRSSGVRSPDGARGEPAAFFSDIESEDSWEDVDAHGIVHSR